jgi:cytochrome c
MLTVVISGGLLLTAEAAAEVAEDGRTLYEKKCAVCHSTVSGYHLVGPSLAGVIGRPAGTAEGFGGYKGLRGSNVIWTEQALDAWLEDPRAFLGGRDSSMAVRVPHADQRARLIAFLKSLK